jgi:hypothetical protein
MYNFSIKENNPLALNSITKNSVNSLTLKNLNSINLQYQEEDLKPLNESQNPSKIQLANFTDSNLKIIKQEDSDCKYSNNYKNFNHPNYSNYWNRFTKKPHIRPPLDSNENEINLALNRLNNIKRSESTNINNLYFDNPNCISLSKPVALKKKPGRKKKLNKHEIEEEYRPYFNTRLDEKKYDEFSLNNSKEHPNHRLHIFDEYLPEKFLRKKTSAKELDLNKFSVISNIKFTLPYFNKVTLTYLNFHVKFSVNYVFKTSTLPQELKIISFFSLDQNHKLKNLFTDKNYPPFYFNFNERKVEDYLISSFSITGLDSPAEEFYNLVSNLKLENNYALLSNRLENKQTLILIDTKKFYHSEFLPDSEYSILYFRDEIFQDLLKIDKQAEISILTDFYSSESPQIFNVTEEKNLSLSSIFLDLSNKRSKQSETLINLNYQLRKNKEELKTMQILLDKKNCENEMMSQKVYDYENLNKSHQKDLIYYMSLETSLKEKDSLIQLLEEKVDEIENKRSSEYAKGQIYSSEKENKFKVESRLNMGDSFLCHDCKTNTRETVLINCGHSLHCYECISNYGRKKKRKNCKTNKKKEVVNKCDIVVVCPICKVESQSYLILKH